MKIFLLAILWVFAAVPAMASENGRPGTSPYDRADDVNGGLLYDKFWKPGEVSARFANQHGVDVDRLNRHADFYRCKSCHGWDRKGRDGYYIKKSPKKAEHPNVAAVDLVRRAAAMTPAEIFAAIKRPVVSRPISYDPGTYDPAVDPTMGDRMPEYGAVFTDSEIWDLVKFLKQEAPDQEKFYTLETEGSYPGGIATFADIGKDGDAANGNAVYAQWCAACHGDDGRDISIKGLSVGAFARTKTYELAHKVKFGQPGSNMHGSRLDDKALKDLHKALADPTTFPAMDGR